MFSQIHCDSLLLTMASTIIFDLSILCCQVTRKILARIILCSKISHIQKKENDVLHQNTEDISRPNDVLESNALLLLLESQSAANGELKPPESNAFEYHDIQDGFNHMAT